MAKAWQFYDAAGVLRNVKEPWLYASDGTLHKVAAGYFYDANGVLRQFYAKPATLGQSQVYMPGLGTTPRDSAGYLLWTVPAGVTSINVAAIAPGGGGATKNTNPKGGGGGGGGLTYANNVPVTPGEILRLFPGNGGQGAGVTQGAGTKGDDSHIFRNSGIVIVSAYGGAAGSITTAAALGGGGFINSGTGVTGSGGNGAPGNTYLGGGGGAGGYGGSGGAGVNSNGSPAGNGYDGSSGGGGGGAGGPPLTTSARAGCGGGTGIFGVGASGAGGVYTAGGDALAQDGGPGSGGQPGGPDAYAQFNGAGRFGGGGCGINLPTSNTRQAGRGGAGAVIIRWGAGSEFPTLLLPNAQTWDFTLQPAFYLSETAVLTYAKLGGMLGAAPKGLPTLGNSVACSGVSYFDYYSSVTTANYYICLSGLSGPVSNFSTIFKRLTIDGLGYFDAVDAIAPVSTDYNPSTGQQLVNFPPQYAHCPKWVAGTPYTCRFTY